MLLALGAGEVLRDLVDRLATAAVAMQGQTCWIAFAGDDRADDGHPGGAREFRDGAMYLDVHLVERLLHPLDATTAFVDEVGHLPLQGTEPADRLRGSERPSEQTTAMKELDPLAVAEVGLSSRDVVKLPGVDENDLQAARLEELEHRDPVDVRALHGDRRHALLDEPVGELVELRGRGAEDADVGCAIGSGRSADPVLRAADVHAGDHRLKDRECRRSSFRRRLLLAASLDIRYVHLARRTVPARAGDCVEPDLGEILIASSTKPRQ